MAVRSKDDAERMRALAHRLYVSNDTIDWFLSSSNAAQLRAACTRRRFARMPSAQDFSGGLNSPR